MVKGVSPWSSSRAVASLYSAHICRRVCWRYAGRLVTTSPRQVIAGQVCCDSHAIPPTPLGGWIRPTPTLLSPQAGNVLASQLRTAGYKDHDSTFCRPRSKPHRPVMHGAPTTRAPCQSLAQDHSQPSSAMRLRMDSLPSMCIILELYTTRSMTASASAPSPMRSCQPDGPYCEQSISDPLR